MNDECDIRLGAALHLYRAGIELDVEIPRRGQIAANFLNPVTAFLINPAFLGDGQRCERDSGDGHPSEFESVLQ